VWRNPERTMTRIFPDARDYRSITARISAEQRAVIEKALGYEMLPGQQDQFQYYEMLDATGARVGTIIPSTQKGEFGAVEFVFGLGTDAAIKGLYIQRARERDQSFKDRAFLDLFVGRSAAERDAIVQIDSGGSTPGRQAVIRGLFKELTTMDTVVAAVRDQQQPE
jgi:hypothetical protein